MWAPSKLRLSLKKQGEWMLAIGSNLHDLDLI